MLFDSNVSDRIQHAVKLLMCKKKKKKKYNLFSV